mmetsp:Transcript_987/g.1820  ORF Transcript_987/g.1820 Transcript_987/m.1820 type:complete len:201 (+) Transcript_987:405-1007(+)
MITTLTGTADHVPPFPTFRASSLGISTLVLAADISPSKRRDGRPTSTFAGSRTFLADLSELSDFLDEARTTSRFLTLFRGVCFPSNLAAASVRGISWLVLCTLTSPCLTLPSVEALASISSEAALNARSNVCTLSSYSPKFAFPRKRRTDTDFERIFFSIEVNSLDKLLIAMDTLNVQCCAPPRRHQSRILRACSRFERN